jgi:o-succinylbenzoate synthase
MNLTPFSLPLSDPLGTAAGEITEREGTLIRYDHREQTGIGEATPLAGWTESLDACRDALDRADDAERGGGHTAALLELPADSVPAARHGFGTAILDADARADGVPLYQWFDADRRCDAVPVNATIGDGDPDATADAVSTAVSAGFECCKIKVGARSLSDDIERIRAVRTERDAVTLRLDANGSWDRETAATAIDRFEEFDIQYIEQPLPADDLDGHADLRGGTVGIALDESLAHNRVDTILSMDAADVFILKPMVLGGPGNAHTLAMRARSQGVSPVVTTTIDGAVARLAAIHVAAAIPDVAACGLATGDRLDRDLVAAPVTAESGRIAVPQSPGLGVDPAAVMSDG